MDDELPQSPILETAEDCSRLMGKWKDGKWLYQPVKSIR